MNYYIENEIDFLNQSESEFLDFKQKFSSNKADLVHDILCMANCSHNGSRYLVFGVTDNKEVVGIDDKSAISSHDLYDLFKNLQINRIPKFKLNSLILKERRVFCLEIYDLPNKPYFLLKDYNYQGSNVRAGVVYTRTGCTNTPISGTASDLDIEMMYEEKFGIKKTPLERFEDYLADTDGWRYKLPDHSSEMKELVFHYERFPEFTIQINYFEKVNPQYWELEFDGEVTHHFLRLKFHSTELEKFSVLRYDRGDYHTLMPKLVYLDREGTDFKSYYFVQDSKDFFLNKIIQEVYMYRMHRPMEGVFSVHESHDEARKAFMKDYENGIKKYVFYFFNPDERRTFRADSTGRRAMQS